MYVKIAVTTPSSGPSSAPAAATVATDSTAADAPTTGSTIRKPIVYVATAIATPPTSRHGHRRLARKSDARGPAARDAVGSAT